MLLHVNKFKEFFKVDMVDSLSGISIHNLFKFLSEYWHSISHWPMVENFILKKYCSLTGTLSKNCVSSRGFNVCRYSMFIVHVHLSCLEYANNEKNPSYFT